MKPDTRRAVAYIAARAISGKTASTLYDFDASSYFHFSGQVSTERARVYDFASSAFVSGPLRSLYHFGHGSHIQLKLNGAQFRGYDFEDSRHFKGKVQGQKVSLYDFATSRYHNYKI